MTKIRDPLTIEHILSKVINKLDENEVKNITNKSISHFRKCSDPDDKDHNLHYADAIKLDILMQRKALGTPFIDNFSLLIEDEFNKNNVYENVASTLIKIGGRMGNLMDTTQQAMSPDSQMGKEISKKEKDQIFKAINEVEEKIAKLLDEIETWVDKRWKALRVAVGVDTFSESELAENLAEEKKELDAQIKQQKE